jgi:hypothetical protein
MASCDVRLNDLYGLELEEKNMTVHMWDCDTRFGRLSYREVVTFTSRLRLWRNLWSADERQIEPSPNIHHSFRGPATLMPVSRSQAVRDLIF